MRLNHKESAWNAGVPVSIPGDSPGEGNGYLLQYSCWENHMDRGASWGTVHGVTESQTGLNRLSTHALRQQWGFTLKYCVFYLVMSLFRSECPGTWRLLHRLSLVSLGTLCSSFWSGLLSISLLLLEHNVRLFKAQDTGEGLHNR